LHTTISSSQAPFSIGDCGFCQFQHFDAKGIVDELLVNEIVEFVDVAEERASKPIV
jgi:hypothetical protein